ncbi:MAG: CoA transferase [Proteobacteria bacterium]|nr:CoA transferase [Pseudomonadota bacterium]
MATLADHGVYHSALNGLLDLAGLEGEANAGPCEPLALDTRFYAAEGASAALGAGAIAADALMRSRGGSASNISLRTRHAEASLMSFAYLNFHDEVRAAHLAIGARTLSFPPGFYPTKDGRFMFMHPAFEHNVRGLTDLLGVDEPQRIPQAVANWNGAELENEIANRGLCSAMARSAEEWDSSVAGKLLASRPVVDIVQIGEGSPVELSRKPDRPLSTVRVLDLTRILAGPTCARTLASYGASVVRIGAEHLPSIPLFVADTGFGKQSTWLDLSRADDAARLKNALASTDVFSQGYRSGAMDRLGFSPFDVARIKPGIVYVSINCYGHEGGWRTRPGWEQLAQTVSGMAITHGGDRKGPPELQPAAVTDYSTGYLAAYGAMVALARRQEIGGSYWVRVSLTRTAQWYRSLGYRKSIDAAPIVDDDLGLMRSTMNTQWGSVDYLHPPVQLSNAPVGWDLPPVALGSHPAALDT